MSIKDLSIGIRFLETSFGLPDNFYNNLLNEDDWSFVIKLHALLEAAVSQALSEVVETCVRSWMPKDFEQSDLGSVFSWLEMSNTRTGKIAFVKGLDILDKDRRRFIISLSELRNKLVHDVRNVHFSFNEYINSLDKNQFKNFTESFAYHLETEVINHSEQTSKEYFVRNTPKKMIWLGGEDCLIELAYCIAAFKFVATQQSSREVMTKLRNKLREMTSIDLNDLTNEISTAKRDMDNIMNSIQQVSDTFGFYDDETNGEISSEGSTE